MSVHKKTYIFPLEYWYSAKNLSNFVSLSWKLDNPYYHTGGEKELIHVTSVGSNRLDWYFLCFASGNCLGEFSISKGGEVLSWILIIWIKIKCNVAFISLISCHTVCIWILTVKKAIFSSVFEQKFKMIIKINKICILGLDICTCYIKIVILHHS